METKNAGETKTTLVPGGTGKTGRRVVERIAARGLPVRVGSRSGEPPFDWEEEATWAPALRDVESVYVSYYPDLAVPGAVAAVHSFAELAGWLWSAGSGGWCSCPAAARRGPSAPS